MSRVGDKVCTQLYQAALDTEIELDAELAEMEKLKEDDIIEIRRKRMERMRYDHQQKKTSLQAGCGVYDELKDEKDFFAEAKKHKRMVCVFFREGHDSTGILQRHFDELARRHWRVRFCRVNGEKAQFLSEKLHIWMLPSTVLVKDGQTDYTIRGLDEFGGMDGTTDHVEQLLTYREILEEDK